jgi:hypothetical protein
VNFGQANELGVELVEDFLLLVGEVAEVFGWVAGPNLFIMRAEDRTW